ncbi:class I SAM-dependent methyltransferase [Nocardia sp. NPDC058519]|uniref:class I SAM-dependent methyltransferase n=1 Tax=Nocardia sp. NPDC058519 TaxID=3346535 RepID=UPI00365AC1F3
MKNSVEQAKGNASFHYNVPAEFFAHILDESFTYSSAMFASNDESLSAAQARKIATAIDKTAVPQGGTLLEIGSGWGACSLAAARRGINVVAVSPAKNQIDFSRKRAADEGLHVEFLECDYRNATGIYDGIVSIEMIEAVGAGNIGEFFESASDRLKSNGVFFLQFIYSSHARMVLSGRRDTWIRRNIFPGGQILSKQIVNSAAASAGFRLEYSMELGHDYARTLKLWGDRLQAAEGHLCSGGMKRHDFRRWIFYFRMCEAGFRAQEIGCVQWALRRV